ncbi:MAG: type IV secretory system conjugative DNA transfer family protein [Defluviicoccus sp.]|nr:type IV secretory system conjugative DNA transfer family protein [Defluviicoccus sp.]
MWKWIRYGAAWLGLLVMAAGWVWWVLEYGAGRDARIAVLGGAFVCALVVFMAFDRGDRSKVYALAVYSAVLMLCGGMVWLEVVRPALELGPVRFGAGLLSLDARSGVLVLGSVLATWVMVLVWCDLAGRVLARKADQRKKRSRSELYGKSRLLDRQYMRKLEGGSGLLLGQTRAGGSGALLGWPLEGSAVTLAPPRTGKGATIALNYLAPGGRGWGGSTVLIDPRGETYCIVARRRREMGRCVVLIDPFGVVAGHEREMKKRLHLPDVESWSYNPLDFIRKDPTLAARDINVLLDALLTPPSGSNDTSSHFYESARAIIAGYVAWVRFTSGEVERNLQEVHRLLMLPPEDRKGLMEKMRSAQGIAGGLVRVAAERQMQVGPQEAGSNFSTIANQLAFLNYPQLEANTLRSDFDPMDLAAGDVDLFIVVPEEMTEHARAWLRLWITIPNAVAGMTALERDMLIVIDEMPKLGYLKPVMEGYNLAAGKGVHFWCFAQSVSTWDATWGRDNRQILVDLAEVVQILGFPRTDVTGAEALSAAIGTAGFETHSESHSGQVPANMVPAGTQVQVSDQVSVVRERIVTPDEILTMTADEQYVIAAPKDMPRDAFRLCHARYWMRPDARLLADPNPFVLRKRSAAAGKRFGMYGRAAVEGEAAPV